MNHDINVELELTANTIASPVIGIGQRRSTHFVMECVGADGQVKWVEEFDNLVVTQGLNHALDTQFRGSGYTAAWYVGLVSGTPTIAAGDTMASHSGWTEITAYDEAARPALTLAAASGGSANNSASRAEFTVSSNGTTIGGAFITTSSTKGGTTGTLYGAASFTVGNKTLDDDDTLRVTATLTASAA